MPVEYQPLRAGRVFRLWLPMAGTWLMMALEAPWLAALIARLGEPRENLAAFGVAYAVAILFEAPVIMILSAATALVVGPRSLRRLARFTWSLNASITVALLLLLVTPAWHVVASRFIGLPARVVELSHVALLCMIPWPAAIGYRRLWQGLLIRHRQTRRVAVGTLARLGVMAVTALALYRWSGLPGAVVAALAATAGVLAEAGAARRMVRDALGALHDQPPSPPEDEVSYGAISRFYLPLALTSVIGLAVHPIVSTFMGHARSALDSLAVLPVVNSLSFIFRTAGLSYQEVAIALLGEDGRHDAAVGRFAGVLGGLACLTMACIVFTPLADVWFQLLSGLSAELAHFALLPARILSVLPALSVLLSLQRARLVHARMTTPITGSTIVEVAVVVAALAVGVRVLDLVGAVAAAVAFVVGRLAGNLSLVPGCRKARAGRAVAQRLASEV